MAPIIQWLLHTVFIQLSILAFCAPFFAWYIISRRNLPPQEKELGEKIEDFFGSRQMDVLVFVWAMLEASVWFIIPEFLLFLIIFMRIRQRAELLLWDLEGTIAGTILSYFILAHIHLTQVPYIVPGMLAQVSFWYEKLGATALFLQPFSGIPYKVFTGLASAGGISLLKLVLLGALVRIARYAVIYIIFMGLYPLFHRIAYKRYVAVFLVACGIFSFFLLKIVSEYGNGYQLATETPTFNMLQKVFYRN